MSSSDEFEEIRQIADDVCDGDVTPEQIQKLEKLLAVSDKAKSFYLEYVGMHAHMKASNDPQMEFVMRRTQVDEVIMRPAGSTSEIPLSANGNVPPTPTLLEDHQTAKSKNPILWILALACIIMLSYILQDNNTYIGDLKTGRLKDLERHKYPEKIRIIS